MRKRKDTQSGAAIIEFSLTLVSFWIPLILGLIFFGAELMRAVRVTSVTRDVGHMYARGVQFSKDENKTLAVRLARGLDLRKDGTSGDGVIILSTVEYISSAECKSCANLNKWVYLQRTVIGRTALRSSNYGTPDATLFDTKDGRIIKDNYLTQTGARVSNFNLLTVEDGGYSHGTPAYLVESYFRTPELGGIVNRQTKGTYTALYF